MTPKQRRERLFKPHRPNIRPLQIYEGNQYHQDIGILWAAHLKQPFFSLKDVTDQAEFARFFEKLLKTHQVMVVIDQNKGYKSGSGPVAFISCWSDGWRVEPHAEFFPWATKRNVLRVAVSFFQMMRYQQIGVCVVRALKESTTLFNHCIQYGVLQSVGKIPYGDRRGDEYLFSVRGKQNV